MALTPIDVQQKTFRQAFKGYDGGEVDEFLDEVVISLRDNEQKIRDAEDRIAVLEEELRTKGDSDDSIKRAFLAAQRAADDLIDGAKTEATELVAGAKTEAGQIVAAAREEATSLSESQASEKAALLAELDALRGVTLDLRERMQLFVSAADGELEPLEAEGRAAATRFDDRTADSGHEIVGVDNADVRTSHDDGDTEDTEDTASDDSTEVIDLDEAAASNGDDERRSDADGADVAADSARTDEERNSWRSTGPIEDLTTEEVPTLRRPWERGAE